MGGKRQKFRNIRWLVKLQSFKSNETYFKFNSCLRGSQCSSISEEVVGTLGGRLNINLTALLKTD